jgi:hypothetical protein
MRSTVCFWGPERRASSTAFRSFHRVDDAAAAARTMGWCLGWPVRVFEQVAAPGDDRLDGSLMSAPATYRDLVSDPR